MVRLDADQAAAGTPPFGGDPIEDGDIDLVKAGGQASAHERPRDDNLRARDHGRQRPKKIDMLLVL